MTCGVDPLISGVGPTERILHSIAVPFMCTFERRAFCGLVCCCGALGRPNPAGFAAQCLLTGLRDDGEDAAPLRVCAGEWRADGSGSYDGAVGESPISVSMS